MDGLPLLRRFVLVAALAAPGAAQDPLRAWRWRSRLLLVFAPSPDNPDLLAQRRLLVQAGPGSGQRSLVRIDVIGNQASDSSVSGQTLRLAFDVPAQRFCVILVGKDGGEKMRAYRPVSMQSVFATIDAMPMGRAEAARRTGH